MNKKVVPATVVIVLVCALQYFLYLHLSSGEKNCAPIATTKNNLRSSEIREVSHVSIPNLIERRNNMIHLASTKRRITMQELWQKSSEYSLSKANSDRFAYTAILSLYRRTGHVKRWLEHLVGQSHPPKDIWVVFFASPRQEELEKEVDQARMEYYNSTNINIYRASGEMQLKYWTRFQLGLQVKTKYVAIFDDDAIPGKKYIEACMHTINTKDYKGVLGVKGHSDLHTTFFGPVSMSEHIVDVDVVGGSWFMESEWVKLMFRDKPFSWVTAEDWTLCAAVRKYIGLRCFVMPVDRATEDTRGFTSDYAQISEKGDTTGRVAGTSEARAMVVNNLAHRGDLRMESVNRYGQSDFTNVMLFADNKRHIKLLLDAVQSYKNNTVRWLVTSTDLQETDFDDLRQLYKIHNVFSVMLGRDYGTTVREIDALAGTIYHFDAILVSTLSTGVVLIGDGSAATYAAAITAQLRSIPIVNVVIKGYNFDKMRASAINALSAVKVTLSDHKLNESDRDKMILALNMLLS